MSDARKIVDFATEDNAKEMRESLYASIFDRVTAHIEAKKQEVGSTLLGMPLSTESVNYEEDDLLDEELDEEELSSGEKGELAATIRKKHDFHRDREREYFDQASYDHSREHGSDDPNDHYYTSQRHGNVANKLASKYKKVMGKGIDEEDEEMCKDAAKKEVKGHEKRMHGKS